MAVPLSMKVQSFNPMGRVRELGTGVIDKNANLSQAWTIFIANGEARMGGKLLISRPDGILAKHSMNKWAPPLVEGTTCTWLWTSHKRLRPCTGLSSGRERWRRRERIA